MKNKVKSLIIIFLLLSPTTWNLKASKDFPKNKNLPSIEYLYKSPTNEYILGSGDRIQIIVNRQIPNLSGVYTIDGDGFITMPRLQSIYVKGLTKKELTSVLNQKYLEIIYDPKVEINIVNYRPVRVYISGEVENPGLYSISSIIYEDDSDKNIYQPTITGDTTLGNTGIITKENFLGEQINAYKSETDKMESFIFPTLYDFIKKSGGITFYSDLSNVQIIRKDTLTNGGGSKKASVNFLDAIDGIDNASNIRIFDGDRIIVPKASIPISEQISKAINTNLNPKFISIFVSGRVQQPGRILVTRKSTLNDAINISGGTKFLKGSISFVRLQSDGSIEERKFNYKKRAKRGSYKNPYLKTGDFIYVSQSAFNVASEVITEITSPFTGIYSIYKLFD